MRVWCIRLFFLNLYSYCVYGKRDKEDTTMLGCKGGEKQFAEPALTGRSARQFVFDKFQATFDEVYFILVRIKIKHMELNIIRRESTTNSKGEQKTDNETLIMQGK